MVDNPDLLRRFEMDQTRSDPPDHARSIRIFEALLQQARALGVIPMKDPLDGIEVDIRLARALRE